MRSDSSPTADQLLPSDGTRRAWIQLLVTGTVLGLLALALPGPWTAVTMATGRYPSSGEPVGETAMLLTAAMLVWALLLWAAIAAGTALLSRLPGTVGRLADRLLRVLAPAMVRKVLLTVVGASLVTGLAACGTAPASAASVMENGHPAVTSTGDALPAPTADRAVARDRSWIVVEGSTVHLPPRTPAMSLVLALDPAGVALDPVGADHDRPARGGAPVQSLNLDWPVSAPAPSPSVDVDWPTPASTTSSSTEPAPTPAATGRSSSDTSVVVHRGDSLWSIAARHLPAGSSPADIDTAWHHWYSANRAVIGADPNLLLPGQILQPPPPAAPAQRTDTRP